MLKRTLFLLFTFLPWNANSSGPIIFDASGKVGNNRNYAQVGAFIPITHPQDDLVFSDIRAMRHLPHFKKKDKLIYSTNTYEVNLGLGYRKFLNPDLVAGSALYYDLRKAQLNNHIFSALTLNTHLLMSSWQTNLNFYIPVGKKEITKTISSTNTGKGQAKNRDIFMIYSDNLIREKSLSGLDLRISRSLPNLDNVRLGVSFYSFKAKKSISGVGVNLDWNLNDSWKFETNYTYDKIRKSDVVAGFRFSVPSQGKGYKQSPKESLLYTRVERDVDIVTNNDKETVQRAVKKDNFFAVRNNDLSNLSTQTAVSDNLEILTALQKIYLADGSLVQAEDGEVFDFSTVNKIDAADFETGVEDAADDAENQFNNNQVIGTLTSQHAATQNPLSRQVQILGDMLAYQKVSGQGGFYVAGQMMDKPGDNSRATLLQNLYNLYARSASTANQTLTVNLPGYGQVPIRRAGTLLLLEENGQAYAVVGTDVNSANAQAGTGNLPWNAWFGGRAEQKDATEFNTVQRETYEESAGVVALTKEEYDAAIYNGRYFYSPRQQMLVVTYADTYHKYDIAQFTNSANNLRNDPTIAHSMKEMISYHKVPVNELFYLQDRLNLGGPYPNHHDPVYNVRDSNNNDLRIDYYYARALAFAPNSDIAILNAINQF